MNHYYVQGHKLFGKVKYLSETDRGYTLIDNLQKAKLFHGTNEMFRQTRHMRPIEKLSYGFKFFIYTTFGYEHTTPRSPYAAEYIGDTCLPDYGVVHYHIITADQGNSWYLINENKTIIGLANDIYPGLIEKIGANEKLFATDINEDPWHYQSGSTMMPNGKSINYYLVTVDGTHWYASNYETGELFGLVDDVYPGLLKQMAAWKALSDYQVKKKGRIDTKTKELLTAVGFTVTTKGND